jgi:predicted O-methyltransferase YrrM
MKLLFFYFLQRKFLINYSNEISDNIIDFDNNFDYINYERDLISEKMKKNAGWRLKLEEAAFINGLIRKHKPKNILEIGVARGGSAVLILNAIKDIPDSRLVSIDLFSNYNISEKIGHLVNEKFPELMDKWKLYTGDMPHKFLSNLNLKFDCFFLDTAHITPGEFFNFIEALPFLNDNSIVILHDIIWHLHQISRTKLKDVKIIPIIFIL